MAADSTLDWLAESLGWACVSLEGDRLALNGLAQEQLDSPTDFWEAAAELCNLPLSEVQGWATEARRAQTTPDGRYIVFEHSDDRITVAVDLGREHLLRRAEAVDLAASVNHEVANSLAAILGWTERLKRGAADDLPNTLRLIEDCAINARMTARDLLGQTKRPPRVSGGSCDIGQLCSDVSRLLLPQAHEHGVRIDTRAGTSCWAQIERAEAFRVIWNLTLNAIQHASTNVRVSATRRGKRISITVEDDGPGMDDLTRRRASEPYFTTRVEGTGLGLPMVFKTAARAGGSVTIAPTRPGTRIEVDLPGTRAREPATSGVVLRQAKPLHVLLVEDDAGVRELVKTGLELRHCTVEVADSVAAARSLSERFDLALVDLTLRDGSGLQVIENLRSTNQARFVVGMSGADAPLLDPPPDGWLRKPFELSELNELLESLQAPKRGARKASGSK